PQWPAAPSPYSAARWAAASRPLGSAATPPASPPASATSAPAASCPSTTRTAAPPNCRCRCACRCPTGSAPPAPATDSAVQFAAGDAEVRIPPALMPADRLERLEGGGHHRLLQMVSRRPLGPPVQPFEEVKARVRQQVSGSSLLIEAFQLSQVAPAPG